MVMLHNAIVLYTSSLPYNVYTSNYKVSTNHKSQYTSSYKVSTNHKSHRWLVFEESYCAVSNNPEWEVLLGRTVGYVSAVFYVGSRLSQIYKNNFRRSVEGLSMEMFATAATANTLYGVGAAQADPGLKAPPGFKV